MTYSSSHGWALQYNMRTLYEDASQDSISLQCHLLSESLRACCSCLELSFVCVLCGQPPIHLFQPWHAICGIYVFWIRYIKADKTRQGYDRRNKAQNGFRAGYQRLFEPPNAIQKMNVFETKGCMCVYRRTRTSRCLDDVCASYSSLPSEQHELASSM